MSITITIDGQQYSAQQGDMIIEVADRHKIEIPRFCYHEKLSIAANCRMCLVEVERAPKPLPACATPVSEGMVVQTKSEKTQLSQKAVMEFLLINHPLDCPICDQGGECELQDLSMKYGYSQSRYKEQKRVAQDFNLGPLVSTDMTRCIHCTRCIRFGSEVAGIKEMGATSRGESTQVGTYLEKHLSSELSANVVDICPVGALTSKPHRSVGRTWELKSAAGVSFMDSFGTNTSWHFEQNKLRRILPRNNAALNENWLPDRDRYSLLGMYKDSRLLQAFEKSGGDIKYMSTDSALSVLSDVLTQKSYGSKSLCGLVHPNTTFEEAYLLQKVFKELGSSSIDYRVQEFDTSDQDQISISPLLPFSLETMLEGPLLIIGNSLSQDMPMLAHRIRQASRAGQKVFQLGWSDDSMNIEALETLAVRPDKLITLLRGLLHELLQDNDHGISLSTELHNIAAACQFNEVEREFFNQLGELTALNIVIAPSVTSIPRASEIRYLSQAIATLLKGQAGSLYPGHSVGCTIAGAHPHHNVMKDNYSTFLSGLDYIQMAQDNLEVLVLFDLDIEDVLDREYFLSVVKKASYVVAFCSFETDFIKEHADLALPLAVLSENEGHHINCFGQEQLSRAAHRLPGDVKQGWRMLRVLADKASLTGFDYHSLEEVFADGYRNVESLAFEELVAPSVKPEVFDGPSLFHICQIHSLRQCELLRQSDALQKTAYAQKVEKCFVNESTARMLQAIAGQTVELLQDSKKSEMVLEIDNSLASGAVQTYSSIHNPPLSSGPITLRKVS